VKIIKEIVSSKGNYYEVYLNEIKISTIKITRVKRERDGLTYLFLFDSRGRVIDEVYRFLNFECIDTDSINAREQMINALKILYSYKEIANKEFKDFDRKDIRSLSNLLLSINVEKENIDNCHIKGRGSKTHNIYLDNIRKFYKYLNIKNDILFEQQVVYKVRDGHGLLSHCKKMAVKKYTTNKRGDKNRESFVPKYISFDEYKRTITYITEHKNKNSLRNRIIVDLMYTTGLRLGEVLGLTLEDIKQNKENHKYGVLTIRNRVTDKKYQNAKTCLKAHHVSYYETKEYKTEGYGYQLINIAPKLFELIQKYIDESRSVIDISEKVMNNIVNFAKADSVEGRKENQYLFLNKDGKPLSSSGWNKFLKSVFLEIGIAIDKGSKKYNLSHKFRHGYAMYLINEEKRSIEYVKDRMRHSSLQSTLIYYNPTREEILKEVKDTEENIRNKLRRGDCNGV